MIEKVISGAQNGADIGGLVAARRHGIPTGGWMPRGFATLDGPRPGYAALYGVREHSSPRYPPRTYQNVLDSDGTIRFAADFSSPGEICTLKAIDRYDRPHFDVSLRDVDPDSLRRCVAWLAEHAIRVLNVAGNTERTHPGCQAKVEYYLGKVFGHHG